MAGQEEYDAFSQFNGKLRSLEEKQRILKERILLIGKNLVDTREKQNEDIGDIRGDISEIKEDLNKMKKSMDRMSKEINRKARKKEVERLGKEMKMFSPLEFARMKDVKKMIKEEINGNNK